MFLPEDEIDPTIDELCYLLSLVIKVVNPAVSQEVAHGLLAEMIERGRLTELDAMTVGTQILGSFEVPEDLH